MPGWKHSICVECWKLQNGERRPVRVLCDDLEKRCCFCGKQTQAGIFVRHEPMASCDHSGEA